MPLPNVTIKNVPMDYFLNGVKAVRPQGAQPPQAPGQQAAGVEQAQQHPAAKMVAQLDLLLVKAARNSTSSLTGSTVKRTLQKLVDDGALDSNSLKALEKAGNTAAKTFKALSDFTGRQLAEAVAVKAPAAGGGQAGAAAILQAPQWTIKENTPAGKAVAAAIKAQQDISDLLAQLTKGLDALVRHDAEMREANPQYRGVDAAVYEKVKDFRLRCDRRATEISELTFQMKEFAMNLPANARDADPNVAAILRAKVSSLLPRQAIAIHDTPDALATANRDIAARLRPVAEKIDAFRRNPTVTIARNELSDLQTEIATMKAALGSIRRDGVEVQGGRLLVPTDIVKALEDEVGKVEIQFRTARKEVLETILRNYLQTAADLYSMPGAIEDACSRDSRKASQMLERRNEFFVALDQLAAAVTDPTKTRADLNALLQNLSQKATRLRLAALETPNVPAPSMQGFNDMVSHIRGVEPMVVEITDIVCRLINEDRFFTGAEAMSVFNGRVTVSSVVEARVRGLQDSDIDPANEPANIASSRPLGTGSGGNVYELTRTDGTTVVFKGETESRTGLQSLAVGGAGNYALLQKTVNLNFASKKAAEALGMGGMIVRYSAGVHNGVFGFHMEKARGCTGSDFVAGRTSSADGLTAKEINKLPAAESCRIKGRIKRALNRLQWLDLVTGQMDRHENNYFIHVDRTTHEVTVTGIDNDAGYSQYRTGAMRFALDEGRTSVFVSQLAATAREIDPAHATALARRFRQDPGIAKTSDKTLTIDATQIADKTIAYAITTTTGAQILSIPDKIDGETYAALVALKEGPQRQAYLDSIRPRLSEASYDAAVSRLDDVIAQAERLRRENKVIDADAWAAVEETRLPTGKLSTRKLDGTEKRLGGTIATEAHKAYCPSIYARDGFEKLFR